MVRSSGPPRGTSTLGFLFGVCRAEALPGPVLVDLLGRMGIGPAAARQLITRLRAMGWLSSERAGRATVLRLHGEMRERFDQIRASSPEPRVWEGAFETVIYELPESLRIERDRLRAAAFARAYAALRPGVLIGLGPPADWLGPFLSLRDDGISIEAGRWLVELADAQRIAEAAWRLDDHRANVRRATAQADSVLERTPGDCWEAMQLMQEVFAIASPLWLSTPNLPVELTRESIGMERLSDAVNAVAERCFPLIQVALPEFLAEHPYAALIRHLPAPPDGAKP